MLCGPSGPSHEFWQHMLLHISQAVLVVVLLEEDTDSKFLNKVVDAGGCVRGVGVGVGRGGGGGGGSNRN